jgi:cation:H+ antiporter
MVSFFRSGAGAKASHAVSTPEYRSMQSLIVTAALLLGSAGVIYFACEYFVNGVEWVGRKFSFGQQATGTILAAFGTALPESVVTFVAVAFGVDKAQRDIGIGAALGGPLALATLAYAVVGVMLLMRRQTFAQAGADRAQFLSLSRDQGWFLVIFVCKLGLGLVTFAYKPWLGVLFLAAYGAYCWQQMRYGRDDDEEGELERLKLAPRTAVPTTPMVLIQTIAALIVIFAASRVFVAQLDALGPHLGLRPQVLALLLAPIATELPETLNAIIWVRQSKTRLALANISGAMMIQATVPTAFGLFYTPWLLQPALLLAGAVTTLTILTMFVSFSRGWISRGFLAVVPVFYVGFVVTALALGLE